MSMNNSPEESKQWDIKVTRHSLEDPMTIAAHPKNWRIHRDAQREGLRDMIEDIGFVRSINVNENTGFCFDGHLRVSLAIQEKQKLIPIEWCDLTDEEEHKALMTVDILSGMADTEREQLEDLYNNANLESQTLAEINEQMTDDPLPDPAEDSSKVPANAQPNARDIQVDLIYTIQGADATCCLAVQAGWGYGIQSKSFSLCANTELLSGRHKVMFIDNDYFDYDHDRHRDVVRELKPKYCTVMDIMTAGQCEAEGIDYIELEQILDWAEELNQYAENVIVIPKYDCLDKIPDHFVLGYSIPTSHGGTLLEAELFRGRRVHLLGGSWRRQLDFLSFLGDDIVSLDNNYLGRIATQFGQFSDENGFTRSLTDAGHPTLSNPRYAALALSFGAIGAKVNSLFAAPGIGEPD